MRIMTVTEQHNNVLFTVSYRGSELRAVQLLDRIGENVYANTVIKVGDLVLVDEVPGLLYGPNMSESDAGEAISHIIVGLIPPSNWREITNFSGLVKGL